MPEITSELRSLIADITEIDEDKIDSDARFIEDLGIDSMMALEILAAIEKKYKVEIKEDSLPKITTLNKTIELVNELLGKKK